MSEGRSSRWPERGTPFGSWPSLKLGVESRQTAEPGEQNCGETQVVTFETAHWVLVYWMVCPEQEYAA